MKARVVRLVPLLFVALGLGGAADAGLSRAAVMRVAVAPAPGVIDTAAGTGTACSPTPGALSCGDGGAATAARLTNPAAVRTLGGSLYVADFGSLNGDGRIRLIDQTGVITTVAGGGACGGAGCGDGAPATQAQLTAPVAVAVDGSHNIFIADAGTVRQVIGATGVITTILGLPDRDTGNLTYGSPGGVAVGGGGNLYVDDNSRNLVTRIRYNPATGALIDGVDANGNAISTTISTDTRLNAPEGLAVDTAGALYVANRGGANVLEITDTAGARPASNATPVAALAAADMTNSVDDVALDASGNIYIASVDGNTVLKQSIGATTPMTVAGSGVQCAAGTDPCGDGGAATQARLNGPAGVALDSAGALYIADENDNRLRVVGGPSQSVSTTTPTAIATTAVPTAIATTAVPTAIATTAVPTASASATSAPASATAAASTATALAASPTSTGLSTPPATATAAPTGTTPRGPSATSTATPSATSTATPSATSTSTPVPTPASSATPPTVNTQAAPSSTASNTVQPAGALPTNTTTPSATSTGAAPAATSTPTPVVTGPRVVGYTIATATPTSSGGVTSSGKCLSMNNASTFRACSCVSGAQDRRRYSLACPNQKGRRQLSLVETLTVPSVLRDGATITVREDNVGPYVPVTITVDLDRVTVHVRTVTEYVHQFDSHHLGPRPYALMSHIMPHLTTRGGADTGGLGCCAIARGTWLPLCHKGVKGCVARRVTRRVVVTTVLYRVRAHVRADRYGRVQATVRLTYNPRTTQRLTLAVTVQTRRGATVVRKPVTAKPAPVRRGVRPTHRERRRIVHKQPRPAR